MLYYGNFYGNSALPSLKTLVIPAIDIPRKPGSSATANYYLNTMCQSLEARLPVGFPVDQAETSQSIGVTPALASTRNPSLNRTESSSSANTSTDTVKFGGLVSELATKLKTHSSSLVAWLCRRHEHHSPIP